MSTLHLNNGSRRFWVFFVTPVSDSSQQPWSFIVPSRSVILRRSCVLLKCSSSPTSWRSLKLWKGHLTISQKGHQQNCQEGDFWRGFGDSMVGLFLLGHPRLTSPEKKGSTHPIISGTCLWKTKRWFLKRKPFHQKQKKMWHVLISKLSKQGIFVQVSESVFLNPLNLIPIWKKK